MKMGAIFFCATAFGLTGGVVGTLLFHWIEASWPQQWTETQAILATGFLTAGIGFLAVVAAIWGVISARTIARRQTTMDLISRIEGDAYQRGCRETYNRLHREHGSLVNFAEEAYEGTSELQAVAAVLNEFEMFSVAIQSGIVDPVVYKKLNNSNVQLYWKNSQTFVVRLRERLARPTLFHEFEEMARWFNDNRIPHRRFWWAGII